MELHEISPFPDEIVDSVLTILGDDERFNLKGKLAEMQASPPQLCMWAGSLAFAASWRRWHQHMNRDTMERLKALLSDYFTPESSAPPAPDPLRQQAEQAAQWDPWRRHEELWQDRRVIGGDPAELGVRIVDTREGVS